MSIVNFDLSVTLNLNERSLVASQKCIIFIHNLVNSVQFLCTCKKTIPIINKIGPCVFLVDLCIP